MKFVLATHNPGKLKEMADILSGPVSYTHLTLPTILRV